MKLSDKSAQKCCIGCFVTFGVSSNEEVNVDVVYESSYRCNVDISFPSDFERSKLAYFQAVLQRIYNGGLIPVRLDYKNVCNVFTLTELVALENLFRFYTFHIYNVPKNELPAQQSTLDIKNIENKVRRQKDRERRSQYMTHSITSANE